MQYMLLIYGNEAAMKSATPADRDAMFKAYASTPRASSRAGT